MTDSSVVKLSEDAEKSIMQLTAASRRVFGLAEKLRRKKFGNAKGEIFTEALLIALHDDENGPTRSLFRAFGIDRDYFMQWQSQDPQWSYPVQERYQPVRLSDRDLLQLPYSKNTQKVLENARRIARAKDIEVVRPRHLLAGLLENKDCVAYGWLKGMAIDIPYAKKILEAVPESVSITPGTFVYAPRQAFSDVAVQEDALGFETSALALAEIIAKPETIPPVVIGVYGPWGSGKSTFLSLVKRHLEDWDEEQYPRSTGKKSKRLFRRLWSLLLRVGRREPHLWATNQTLPRVACVEFNAWAYTDATKLWSGLAKRISARLDQEIAWWQKPYFWFRRNRLRMVGAVIVGLIPAALALIAVFSESLWGWAAGQEPIAKFIALLVGFGGAKLTFSLQTPLTNTVSTLVKKMDKSEAEGVMHRIHEEMNTTVKTFFGLTEQETASVDARGQAKKNVRQSKLKVVVFIDELDRCPLEKIVDILEAIKLFLAEEIFIVLMAVDTRVVAEAIRLHYKEVKNPRLAREYLEKIIQVPVRVPEAHPTMLTQFVDSLMAIEEEQPGPSGGGVGSIGEQPGGPVAERRRLIASPTEPLKPLELSDTPDERDAIAGFAVDYLDSNPRRIKRLLNTYRYVKVLAARRGENTEAPEWQEKMIRWLGFTMSWPDFMELAVDEARATSSALLPDEFLKRVGTNLAKEQLSEEQQPPEKALALFSPSKSEVDAYARLADNFLIENPPTPPEDEQSQANEKAS